MKKKLNKYEKKLIENIQAIQLRSLSRIKERAQLLQESVAGTIKKIESEGINGYYSVNHDCMRFAQEVWKESLRLGELKRLEDNLKETFTSFNKKKIKEKDT
jgi:hypothetical protein